MFAVARQLVTWFRRQLVSLVFCVCDRNNSNSFSTMNRVQTKFVVAAVAFTVVVLVGLQVFSSPHTDGKRSKLLSSSHYYVNYNGKPVDPIDAKRMHEQDVPDEVKSNIIDRPGRIDKKPSYSESPHVKPERFKRHRVALIADLDTDSKMKPPEGKGKDTWISYMRRGYMQVEFDEMNPHLSKITLDWDSGDPVSISSGLSQEGRGMELSELVSFDNNLITCDDRTGILYKLVSKNGTVTTSEQISPIPWAILSDGDGKSSTKGFKCEWACVKEGSLYVGGLGKEWTTSQGELLNYDPQWIKRVDTNGRVEHIYWRDVYVKLAEALGIKFPGYVIHESGGWSDVHRRWMFLPRRVSKEKYDEALDESRASNIMLLASEDFKKIQVNHVGALNHLHGFSSFKWIPNTRDSLVASLKTIEHQGKTETFLTVFSMSFSPSPTDGEDQVTVRIILEETNVGDHKYEGIEFI